MDCKEEKMHCFGKEYRVVCAETSDKRLVIDIVPADEDALHMLILQERQKISEGIKIIAGSIALYDMGENAAPEILFLPSGRGGIDFDELPIEKEKMLCHKIRQKFADMMAHNVCSTLNVREEIKQEYVSGVIASISEQCDTMMEAQKSPNSTAEEKTRLYKEKELKKARIRAERQAYLENRDAKYSPYHLTALQIRQLIYNDY